MKFITHKLEFLEFLVNQILKWFFERENLIFTTKENRHRNRKHRPIIIDYFRYTYVVCLLSVYSRPIIRSYMTSSWPPHDAFYVSSILICHHPDVWDNVVVATNTTKFGKIILWPNRKVKFPESFRVRCWLALTTSLENGV